MEFKSFDDVRKLHEKFTGRFEKRLAEIKKELPKSVEALLDTKRAAVKHAREAIKAAEKTRDALVKRVNNEIAAHEEKVAWLSREISELEGAREKAPKAAKVKRAAKPKRAPKPKPEQ